MKSTNKKTAISISVIMPAYNAAEWLPKTIPRVEKALQLAKPNKVEIIIVDDGSSDGTAAAAKALKTTYPLKVISQPNSGRFLARDTGTKAAQYDYILFIDTRIYIKEDGLLFLVNEMAKNPERKVWTSHVYLDKDSNMYARFWDALTSIAWRKYFSNPRDYSYGPKEFDYYPKGTTCFFVPRKIIKDVNDWFTQNTKDLKTSNDDTLLIRRIAETNSININPEFACTYHARSTFGKYSKHVFHRGKVFVDGFLRRDGNRFFWPLVTALALSVIGPILFVVFPPLFLAALTLALVAWLAELPLSMALGIDFTDAWSLTLLTPWFIIIYGAGIWTALIKLYIPPFNRTKE